MVVDATHFPLESCCVIMVQIDKNVTRKFSDEANSTHQNHYLSFDGVTFEVEASSKYRHVGSTLGSYRNSPFLTGDNSANGLKTEILDIEAGEWERVADYPISDGDR